MDEKEQEIPQIELLTPLTGEFFPDDSGYDYEEELDDEYGLPLDGEDLAQYEESISESIRQHNDMGQEQKNPCNLMEYFHGSEAIREKVTSAVVSAKHIDGVLYGCTTLTLQEFLEAPELQELCEYITGQYADGWGEGFEQKEIPVDGGYINVHFYQRENFRIQEQEAPEPEQEAVNVAVPKPPKMKLLGHDGNIFSIMGDAKKLLCRNGQGKEAEEMYRRVKESGSYYKALGIISEYVETELSTPQKPERHKKKPERGESR